MKLINRIQWTSVPVILAITLGLAVVVSAVPAPKVFVCKYVGTPGTDERLQTGQNPISVSSNAIQNYQGVGSYFNDQHGRSYVLVVDYGQPEPNVSQCPGADEPEEPSEEPETPEVTTTPPVTEETEAQPVITCGKGDPADCQ